MFVDVWYIQGPLCVCVCVYVKRERERAGYCQYRVYNSKMLTVRYQTLHAVSVHFPHSVGMLSEPIAYFIQTAHTHTYTHTHTHTHEHCVFLLAEQIDWITVEHTANTHRCAALKLTHTPNHTFFGYPLLFTAPAHSVMFQFF